MELSHAGVAPALLRQHFARPPIGTVGPASRSGRLSDEARAAVLPLLTPRGFEPDAPIEVFEVPEVDGFFFTQ